MPAETMPDSVSDTSSLLASGNYVANRALATSVFLALSMQRPLLLEGAAGVGKTELARVLAVTLGRKLLRLQCYDGLDLASAAYEWNFARQMLAIRRAEAPDGQGIAESDLYADEFLLERPLLSALRSHPEGPPVLLIDELDRADEPFEAYLLEILADYQLSIPESRTVAAATPPIVVITSNRTREVHDALRRRCFYHWLDYPDIDTELEILRIRAPDIDAALARQLTRFVQLLRHEELYKAPGIAETIDWARALQKLDVRELNNDAIEVSIGALLKYQDDVAALQGGVIPRLLSSVQSAA